MGMKTKEQIIEILKEEIYIESYHEIPDSIGLVKGCFDKAAARLSEGQETSTLTGQVSEVPEDIREYVGKAMYDDAGQIIFRGADKDNLKQFLDIRGWGAIQNMFKTPEEAEAFQDKVGQWVTDVINAKLSHPQPITDSRIEEIANKIKNSSCTGNPEADYYVAKLTLKELKQ
jgi:hypothetical protein